MENLKRVTKKVDEIINNFAKQLVKGSVLYEDDRFIVKQVDDIRGFQRTVCFDKESGRNVKCEEYFGDRFSNKEEKGLGERIGEAVSRSINNISGVLPSMPQRKEENLASVSNNILDVAREKVEQIREKIGTGLASFLKGGEDKKQILSSDNQGIFDALNTRFQDVKNKIQLGTQKEGKELGAPSSAVAVGENEGLNKSVLKEVAIAGLAGLTGALLSQKAAQIKIEKMKKGAEEILEQVAKREKAKGSRVQRMMDLMDTFEIGPPKSLHQDYQDFLVRRLAERKAQERRLSLNADLVKSFISKRGENVQRFFRNLKDNFNFSNFLRGKNVSSVAVDETQSAIVPRDWVSFKFSKGKFVSTSGSESSYVSEEVIEKLLEQKVDLSRKEREEVLDVLKDKNIEVIIPQKGNLSLTPRNLDKIERSIFNNRTRFTKIFKDLSPILKKDYDRVYLSFPVLSSYEKNAIYKSKKENVFICQGNHNPRLELIKKIVLENRGSYLEEVFHLCSLNLEKEGLESSLTEEESTYIIELYNYLSLSKVVSPYFDVCHFLENQANYGIYAKQRILKTPLAEFVDLIEQKDEPMVSYILNEDVFEDSILGSLLVYTSDMINSLNKQVFIEDIQELYLGVSDLFLREQEKMGRGNLSFMNTDFASILKGNSEDLTQWIEFVDKKTKVEDAFISHFLILCSKYYFRNYDFVDSYLKSLTSTLLERIDIYRFFYLFNAMDFYLNSLEEENLNEADFLNFMKEKENNYSNEAKILRFVEEEKNLGVISELNYFLNTMLLILRDSLYYSYGIEYSLVDQIQGTGKYLSAAILKTYELYLERVNEMISFVEEMNRGEMRALAILDKNLFSLLIAMVLNPLFPYLEDKVKASVVGLLYVFF